jgi:membrane protease subunit HflC
MKLTLPLVVVLVLVLLTLSGVMYTIDETEQVIITQFGKPVGSPIPEAGLHFKVPFIQKVNYFNKNLLEWDSEPGQIPTLDKTYIWVDVFARWRIKDALQYFLSVNNETSAQGRLDTIINAATRNLIQSYHLIEVIRETNRTMEIVATNVEGEQARIPTEVKAGRGKMTRMIVEQARPKLAAFGIELVDVQIKRINYISDVQKKVYERMVAERKQIAEKFRSEGQGESKKIEGMMVKELKVITSEAYRKAEEIKGKADAEATRIYAEAYGKDPEFYSFLTTLDMYKNLPEKEIRVLLTTDSQVFQYLKGYMPQSRGQQ